VPPPVAVPVAPVVVVAPPVLFAEVVLLPTADVVALFVVELPKPPVEGLLLLLHAPANRPAPAIKVPRPIRAYERILIAVSSTGPLRVAQLQLQKPQ
jgi:hypothetical protein